MGTPALHHNRVRSGLLCGRMAWLGLVTALIVGVLVALAVGRGGSSGGSESARPDLQRIIDGLVRGPGRVAPRVTAYVAGPRGAWVASAGIARIGTPMRPDARLRLNSMGKMWTATLIMKLVGEGRITLDDRAPRWLPGLLPHGNEITVKQLLDMTSGMVDTNDFYARPADYLARITDPVIRARVIAAGKRARTDPAWPTTAIWIEAAAGQPLLFKPGSSWHYSNIGYMVAGLIAARAGGADLATLFRTQIIDPLHLASVAVTRRRGSRARTPTVTRSRRTAGSWTPPAGLQGWPPTAASSPTPPMRRTSCRRWFVDGSRRQRGRSRSRPRTSRAARQASAAGWASRSKPTDAAPPARSSTAITVVATATCPP